MASNDEPTLDAALASVDRSSGVLGTTLARRSYSKVTSDAPTHEELLPLVAAASRVADHSSLRPWRLIELRGQARARLGEAFVQDAGATGYGSQKLAKKPLRASLLIAIVASRQPSGKVPDWEQDATAAGVAHMLSLLLHAAGWGVMWRTGAHTRAESVARVHGLRENEALLGWLYVGGIKNEQTGGGKKPVDPEEFITLL